MRPQLSESMSGTSGLPVIAGEIHAVASRSKTAPLTAFPHSTALSPPSPPTGLIDMVAPGLQLSERPNLENYIKDGKLVMKYSFPFRKQPIKGLYIVYRFTLLLFILPLWILRYALPIWRPRRSWTLHQAVWVRAHSYYLPSFFGELILYTLFYVSRTVTHAG